ncbi:type I polyketide synthase [Paenalcaligenes faecalis]|uniref:type I polyketide synthase n=1 Tax=Paenalcaligenes faecalis TaxID=2980099 RepID=UPI0022B9CAF7|nr:type I polyketide synthase [Paenalcaligenes faecalis]
MVKKVAIIGCSFRLPNNTNKNNYWQRVNGGEDLVTQVESNRWSFDTYLHPSKSHPGTSYTFAAGSLGDVSLFDPAFFGISPREAALMDPQQRHLLKLSWEAIEDAGIAPSTLRGQRVGVYIGLSSNDYAFRMADDNNAVDSSTATGNTASIAANRISYAFDLQGPSMSLDTACSSSLVAFHQACLSIRSGETPMALAGGISLHLHPYGFISFSKASMLSPTGRCQVFDAAGDGYVRSEGAGLFLLKDYDTAVADGDRILAVVLNSGVNTDGHKQGITVPDASKQAQLIQQTMSAIGLKAEDLDYIEAHGTGTAIGDPIETSAIGRALGQQRSKKLPIGSIKSNMGHLETASGAAGLIKLLYAFEKRVVPPTIGINTLNPLIDFKALNLEVNQASMALPTDKPLRMSINSFGFGGSNAHIILESAPPTSQRPSAVAATEQALPLLISAKSEASLKAYAQQLADWLNTNSHQEEHRLYDVAYQLYQRRDLHAHRALLYSNDNNHAAKILHAFAQGETNTEIAYVTRQGTSTQGPVFVFSGNGSQWEGMGQQLLKHPVFLAAIQDIDQLFSAYSDFSLEAELGGENGTKRYEDTHIAQPALFAIQVGLTQLLAHEGVKPAAVIGHSVGEVAAAWACGALSLEQAVRVIFERSRLQQSTKGQGEMTAVSLSASTMLDLLDQHQLTERISVAGANSSTGCTLAGLATDLDQAEAILRANNVRLMRLKLDYAFHSPSMDSIEAELLSVLADLTPSTPTIPMYSVVEGGLISADMALDAHYWWQNIRQPVLFEPAMDALLDDGYELFVEIGPHPVLRGYIQQAAKDAHSNAHITVLGQRHSENIGKIQQRAQEVLLAQAQPNLVDYFPAVGQFVDLPHYAWDLESYWHPITTESYQLLERRKIHHLLGYALPQQHLAWESQLDTLKLPYLAEHIVGDATLLPGSAFIEIALAAAKTQLSEGEHTVAVENLTISSPLVLQEQPTKILRTYVDDTDGRLGIRSKTVGAEESWVEHAQARVITAANAHWQQTEHLVVPSHTPDFDGESHRALTQQVGLDYGPCFTAISAGWQVDEQHIITQLQLPEGLNSTITDSVLHPALVDSCFQSIIHLLRNHPLFGQGVAFVPVQLEQAYARIDLGPICYGRTEFLRLNPHSLSANFDFYNADGVHIAHFAEVRFRSARLQKAEPISLSYLDDVLIPQPLHALKAALPVDSSTQLTEQIRTAFALIAQSTEQQRFSTEIDPLLDSLADLYTKEAVWAYQQQQRIHQEHNHPILDLLLMRLEAIGEGQWQEDTWQMSAPEVSADDVWQDLARDYSEAFSLFLMVARVGMHLSDVLLGHTTLAELRPQNMPLAAQLHVPLGTHNRQRFLKQVAQHLQQLQQQLRPGQRLRVLEISGHGPWFAEACLEVIDKNQVDYCYASSNAAALEQAQQLQESYPQFEYELINLEQIPSASFDVLLMTADIEQPTEVQQALVYAQQVLLPQGQALLYGVQSSYWQQFSYADTPYTGLLEQDFWQDNWEQFFSDTTVCKLESAASHSAYALISSANTATAKPTIPATETQQWYVIADTPLSMALAAELQQLLGAENCHCVSAFDANALPDNASIIYLAGLHATAETPTAVPQHRGSGLLQLVQNYPHPTPAQLWVVCSQATAHTMAAPYQAAKANEVDFNTLNDAALWGFGRSLMNESELLHTHLVDLPALNNNNVVQLAQQLATELRSQSPEREVVYLADGSRYVPRLQLQPAPAELQAKNSEATDVRLDFKHAGQLRNLQWCEVKLPPLEAGQIKVRIHATGLNFRDVMYTMGMLSDEAVENGFAGASLGLEFAGVVESTAANVSDYKVGDRVVGFGAHSFGTRTISDSSAMAVIPDFIDFEAAATIPSTFFTVYYALQQLAQLERGERILIHGAAGGVGIAAIQLATHLGAEIYATVSSDEKRDFLTLMGVKHIYDSRSLAFADDILADTQGEGVDVVLNSLAGEAINRNLHILRPFGRFLELGKRDFYQNSRIGLRPFRNNISYFGIDADQLMRAKPVLTQRLFKEMMQLIEARILVPLPYKVFEANQVVEAFRYMQQARQIGKIVVTYEQPIRDVKPLNTTTTPLQLDSKATYVVTGGLGGFGLRTAQWLVEKGAQHLTLLSRRGAASEEAQDALAAFTQQGINVQALACDITDAQALKDAFEAIDANQPAIKGIVHAATVIDDALIANMQPEQLLKVLEPKILGAWHLHEQSLRLAQPLDFFVVYSSATTLFGNLGQSNYVAANYWLEALMGLRQQLGLAATNVRWGAIDDVGFLARNQKIKDALQGRMGGASLPAALALSALEAMLVHKQSHLGVMELDWAALDRFLPTAHSPKFEDLAHLGGAADNEGSQEDWAALLETLSPAELQSHVSQLIRTEISAILRLPVERIEANQSIYDMGLDSLLGVELVLALEDRFGVRIPAMALSESPTITRLADKIIELLQGQGHSDHAEADSELSAQVSQLAAQHSVTTDTALIQEAVDMLSSQKNSPNRRIIH